MRQGAPFRFLVFSTLLLGGLAGVAPGAPSTEGLPPFPAGIGAADQDALRSDLLLLRDKLTVLRARPRREANDPSPQEVADAELFYKSAVWALRYEPTLAPAEVAQVRRSLQRGIERANALLGGQQPWSDHRGKLVRGYRSRIDASVQPYGLVIPAGYDPKKPARLDVVLHGSTRPSGLSELRFLSGFDEGDGRGTGPAVPYLELHPLGRVENGYRWAGEEDVFEAIASVKSRYNIDPDRIVLRGMSMGASGTWHLGLKHPDQFVALGPYCGYVDTHRFSETPLPNFIKVGPLPEYQERGLHMLDSVDYAANAGVVPAIGAIGDKDVFFDAHVIMGKAMQQEGLRMVNIISPGTGHVQDPATHAEQLRQIADYVARGRNTTPRHLRFVTWTLKYSRCFWLQALGLKQHYQRAELDATARDDGSIDVKEPVNVTRFAILPPMLQLPVDQLRIGGSPVPLPSLKRSDRSQGLVIVHRDGRWVCLGTPAQADRQGKRPGLQGPIDDAFTSPFLLVRGTGKPWNPAVGAWSEASLQRFVREWSRYFRGDLQVRDDVDVTDEDLRRGNLILWGDPGSNLWIRKALPKLPIRWSEKKLQVGARTYSAADHAPLLACPNPLPGGEGKYLVLNSGHTFHEAELASLNYLLFPRLGDWAVMEVGKPVPGQAADLSAEHLSDAGILDENWRVPGTR